MYRTSLHIITLAVIGCAGAWWVNEQRIKVHEFIAAKQVLSTEASILEGKHVAVQDVTRLHTAILHLNTNSAAGTKLKDDLLKLTAVEQTQLQHPLQSLPDLFGLPGLYKDISENVHLATNRTLDVRTLLGQAGE